MAQQFGIAPESIAALTYTGPDLEIIPVTEADRDPTVNDKQYPIDCFWRNTITRDLFFLSGFDITGALWVKFLTSATLGIQRITVPAGMSPVLPTAGGTVGFTSTGGSITITGGANTINFDITSGGSPVSSINVDANTGPGTDPVLPTGGGQITVTGGQVAAGVVGTNVIRTDSLAASTYTIEIQRSTAVPATAVANNGVSHFNSAQFTVDGNGFVSLVGGTGPVMQTVNVDANTAPGTDPVVPTAGGVITVTGSQVAAGVVGTNVIRTDSLAANTYTIEIQRSAAVGASTVASNGVSHFDSAIFTVDANAFVSLVGGSVPVAQKFNVDANTAPGTDPVVATALGVVNVTGAQVAAGVVGANVIRTDSLAANTITWEIQRSAAVASSASVNNGVSHFDSNQFTVDANGFVRLAGTGNIIWLTTAVSIVNMTVNRGYICIAPGGALTLGLPATATLGDIIEITLDGATSFQVTQAAGQQIRFGSSQTTAGAAGSIQTTLAGDTVRMVAQSATKWNILSSIGNFTIV